MSTSPTSRKPDSPVRLPRYIELAVTGALDRRQMARWLASARRAAPSGVLATVQAVDDQGCPRGVCMVHQEGRERHRYRIPLSRDLLPGEVARIVAAFAKAEPRLDFDVETNETRLDHAATPDISGDDADHLERGMMAAKARHAAWMRERLADGWRFGVQFSVKQKTHPLLRPFEQLPDRFRKPDLDAK